ncbi:hypothetical protein N4R57_16425 [Rhodobacteraceae bacterium D3-12]|nr:hypothetical protein N4R57_16425 [Rhodobacteraceae bacterium D3-12]
MQDSHQPMFYSIFQSLSSVTLAGLGCFLIFVSPRLQGRLRLQQALIGFVFGVLTIVLTSNAYVMQDVGGPIDANAGPLIFAGYLGGPIGAAIAASLVTIARVQFGGPFVAMGLYVLFGFILSGLLVARLRPPRPWPMPPSNAIGFLVLGFVFF